MRKLLLLALLVVLAFTQNAGEVVVVESEQVEATEGGSAEYEIKDGVYHLTNDNLKRALEEFDYVLVKFFAPWCGHCKTLAPVWIEVARALSEGNSQAKIAEVDCTVHQTACQQNGIRGYPTMLWFQKGKQSSEKYTGARNTESFVTWINQKILQSKQNVGQL